MTGGEWAAMALVVLGIPAVVWVMLTPHEPRWLRDLTRMDEGRAVMAAWHESGRTRDFSDGDRWRIAVSAETFMEPEFTFADISTGATVCVPVSNSQRKQNRNLVGKVKARMYAKAREQGLVVRARVVKRPYGVDVEGTLLRS